MSIINQALQKAQRAQLSHSQQELPYPLPMQLARTSRRWRFWLPLGLVMAVGAGATFHAWLLSLTVRTPGDTAPPATPQPVAVYSPSVAPPTTVPPTTPIAQPVAEAMRPERQNQPVRPVPETLPPAASLPLTVPAPSQEVLTSVTPLAVPPTPESARAQTLVQRAIAAQEGGELTRALALLEQAVKLDPTAKAAYNSLGNVYYQQRRYQQAIAMYQKALAIDPDYAKARNNLGSTYMQLAMDTQAIDELQKALRSDRSSSLAYYNLACVYARNGNSATAAQYLQQAIALEPQARTWAQTDADFARVRTALEVQQLLGP